MNTRRTPWLLVAVLLLASPALADDLEGAGKILCTAVQATECPVDGDCTTRPPWALNVPQFIVVDLDGKMLATTEASGENRSTPIKHMEREDGTIYLQGVEGGRAFSFVIAEDTGKLTVAVATQMRAVSVFGACTPVP